LIIFDLAYRRFVIGRTLPADGSWQVKNLQYSAARPSRNQDIQQPTSNAQHPMFSVEQQWELDVGC
jgi:hypothetical protein